VKTNSAALKQHQRSGETLGRGKRERGAERGAKEGEEEEEEGQKKEGQEAISFPTLSTEKRERERERGERNCFSELPPIA